MKTLLTERLSQSVSQSMSEWVGLGNPAVPIESSSFGRSVGHVPVSCGFLGRHGVKDRVSTSITRQRRSWEWPALAQEVPAQQHETRDFTLNARFFLGAPYSGGVRGQMGTRAEHSPRAGNHFDKFQAFDTRESSSSGSSGSSRTGQRTSQQQNSSAGYLLSTSPSCSL